MMTCERNAVGAHLDKLHKAAAGSAMARHIAAIESGNVTKTNVIGLRKALNHVAKLARGWGGDRVNATAADVQAALAALERHKPLVRGDLHESGVRLLCDRRNAKRLASVADIVASLQGFRLVSFYELERAHHTPIYQAEGTAGSFQFYNVPWQTALYMGVEGGPHIMGGRANG